MGRCKGREGASIMPTGIAANAQDDIDTRVTACPSLSMPRQRSIILARQGKNKAIIQVKKKGPKSISHENGKVISERVSHGDSHQSSDGWAKDHRD
jgi:hypothetical protein